ncbi:LysR family transcriptional regulator [Variovorax ginsengisoli]|uniref:DNA-binding transcriptional LysR family regulator n=1 Tax=Variovorax ginsengisoli TaxID=363844 RepID=A0ABT9S819_9BURK|nr:LysR family transcriptional regulator [Variovorax ginsengisoli]MDP9900492.1 DNA-binding transcriptional LysR family regulator [Variovorax ginsengisoli]
MNISLRQLRVFLAAAQARNFSRAGDAVGLTQPAVSRAILELEAQLGLKLLDRTTREVVVTEAGQSLAARLERVLEELDQALLDVKNLGNARRGKVRVASSPTLSANLMPACIAACARQEPDIELVLLDRIQQDVLDRVRGGEVDFGVVVEPSASDDLHCESILDDPFVLIVPRRHPWAARTGLRWSALDGTALVLLDHASGSRRLIDDALRAQGAHCPVAQELGHPTTVFRMVEAGIGLSVMPALAVPSEGLGGLVALPLLPRVQRAIMLVHRRNRAPSPLAQRVWQLVRETVSPSTA